MAAAAGWHFSVSFLRLAPWIFGCTPRLTVLSWLDSTCIATRKYQGALEQNANQACVPKESLIPTATLVAPALLPHSKPHLSDCSQKQGKK